MPTFRPNTGFLGPRFSKLTKKPSQMAASTIALTIAGVTRDLNGSPLAGCTVKLFETGTDKLYAQQVSDGGGNYSFTVQGNGVYYVVAFLAGSPDVAGASDNNVAGS